jgi:hypothetical protein
MVKHHVQAPVTVFTLETFLPCEVVLFIMPWCNCVYICSCRCRREKAAARASGTAEEAAAPAAAEPAPAPASKQRNHSHSMTPFSCFSCSCNIASHTPSFDIASLEWQQYCSFTAGATAAAALLAVDELLHSAVYAGVCVHLPSLTLSQQMLDTRLNSPHK